MNIGFFGKSPNSGRKMKKKTHADSVDEIVAAIQVYFRTFGGGQDSEFNPLTHALKDKPLQFAAGVDVKEVVEFILARHDAR